MAKKKGTAAAAIREYLKAHPEAKGPEVIEAMKKAGFTIASPQITAARKTMEGGGKKTGKRGPKPKGSSDAGGMTIDQLVKTVSSAGGLAAIAKAVKELEAVQDSQKLIEKIGGIDAARKLVSIK